MFSGIFMRRNSSVGGVPVKDKIILGSAQKNTIKERFKIIGSLLSGKRDVNKGSTHGGIVEDTKLSAASIKNFLNTLAKEGFVNKKYIPASSGPVCFVGNAAHNEYTLNKKGVEYVKAQMELWMKSGNADLSVVDVIKNLADSYVEPSKVKPIDDYFMLTREHFIGKKVSSSLISKFKIAGVSIEANNGMYSITFD
jgi:predicted transcriptional regulator